MPASPDLTRQFIWTVIPSGRIDSSRQRGLFAVLLIPKLIGPRDTTVRQFAMQSWPRRLNRITFTALRGETPIETTTRVPFTAQENRTIQLSEAQQQSAWQAMFPESMLVRARRPTSYQGRRVNEFPAGGVGTQIRDAFTQTARALTDLEGDDADQRAQRHAELRRIAGAWQGGALAPPDQGTDVPVDEPALQRAYKFYCRDESDFTWPEELLAEEPPDFHDVVARLADHPILLRALGLLIDFEVPISALTTGTGPNEMRIGLKWPIDPAPEEGWGNAVQQDVRPKTAYVVAGSRFVPLTPPNQAPQGVLPLAGTGLEGEGTNNRFEVMPFDVDGAALRMSSLAQSERGQLPETAVVTAGLPTLRSMGLALVDRNRRIEHSAQLRRATERDTPEKLQSSPLTAENLTAGYRVDIVDNFGAVQGPWRSLCQRRVRYIVGGVRIGHEAGKPGLLEEGYVRRDFATTGGDPSNALYIHQTVVRWDGFSLVIPRPDRVVRTAVATVAATPPQGFTVSVDQEPGSLPRLRFGHKYRLRVRLVDLAGGGLLPEEAETNEQSDPIMHRRFEPILAPELAPTARYLDGSGHEQMVIRSDRGMTAAAYAAANGYRPVDLRYLFAPKSSLELAMQHERENAGGDMVGVFDSALGPGVHLNEVRRQFDIAKRADYDLGNLPGADLVVEGRDSAQYFVVPDAAERVTLPWLPDVAADFLGLRVAEGGRPINPETNRPGETEGFKDAEGQDKFIYAWKGMWPNRVPIALKVEEADPAATVGCTALKQLSGDRRTFTIKLKPAEQVAVDIFSGLDEDFVPKLGVAHWAGAHPSDPMYPVNNSILRGRNPLVTPPRKVSMIHAVQRPLSDPSGQFVAKRALGDTHAILDSTGVDIHVPSTGRIDVQAKWTEIEDIPTVGPPQTKTVVVNVGSFDIGHKPPRLDPPEGAFPVIRQEFGDARRRKVVYTVEAISRFRDYFGRLTERDPKACTAYGVLTITDLPSTVRPAVPKVRNIIPTFRWSRSTQGNVSRSSRRGGGLRVLLERPWFVTGADEALAVVTWPEGASGPTAKDLQQLSLAGRDPIWNAPPPPRSILSKAHFGAEANTATAVLPELDKQVVAVISPLDERNYDQEADCWYADIDLSPLAMSSYFPFVRLVLCRYQARTAQPRQPSTSARDQRLSTPIQTEPLQLFPHRDLTITRTPGKAAVVVKDPNPAAPKLTAIRAELQVFQGDPRAADDALIGGSTGWMTLAQAAVGLGDTIQLDVPPSERRKLRIAVTEIESYPSAGTTGRVVYADIVDL
jgi:hypothetical protein